MWDKEFSVEALGESKKTETKDEKPSRMISILFERSLFVIEKDNQILSFCGTGGFLSDWKWVGPVYTPPNLRGHGYGRAVTGGSLEIVRNEGAKFAGLFSSNPVAIKTYKALGFKEIGDWRLSFLKEPLKKIVAIEVIAKL
ncbi:MAG: GNAT family N-acetyltransferase [Pseudomonadota bacterium]